MTARDQQFEHWKEAANAVPLLEAAHKYGAQLKRNGQEWSGPCPYCAGRDRFSINPTKNKWNCRGAEGGNTTIGMVMHIAQLSFTQACEELTGEPLPNGKSKPLSAEEKAKRAERKAAADAAQRQREAEQEAYEEQTTEAALAIANACVPIKGTLAEVYCDSRGLTDLPDNLPLGFHPSLLHPTGRRYPALVARVVGVDSQFIAIWRIFLSADGKSKAPVEFPKLGLGPAGGGAVRLGGDGAHIGVGEGIETCLAVMKLNALGNLRYPIWAALSTSGMVGLELPLNVSRVTVFPDSDLPMRKKDGEYVPTAEGPGIKAARTLQQRLIGEGVKCSIAALPPPGTDYLNLWEAMAREVA